MIIFLSCVKFKHISTAIDTYLIDDAFNLKRFLNKKDRNNVATKIFI